MRSLTAQYGAKSDTGLKRDHNEDRFGADPDLGLYVVCDGMGGHRAGEIASARAVEVITYHVSAAARNPAHPPCRSAPPGVFRTDQSTGKRRAACEPNDLSRSIELSRICRNGTTVV